MFSFASSFSAADFTADGLRKALGFGEGAGGGRRAQVRPECVTDKAVWNFGDKGQRR